MNTSPSAGLKKLLPAALGHLAVLGALSAALGFTFNAANPTGIRFRDNSTPTAGAKSAAAASAESPYHNTTLLVALTTPHHSHAPAQLPKSTPAPPTTAVPAKSQNGGGPEPLPVGWDEAVKILGGKNSVLIDARPRPTYDAGHIPGAISLTEASQPIDFAAFQQKYSRETVVITYCANTECPVSLKLANKLIREYGYKTVRYMPGGYQEWQRHQATAKPGL